MGKVIKVEFKRRPHLIEYDTRERKDLYLCENCKDCLFGLSEDKTIIVCSECGWVQENIMLCLD